MMERPIRRAGTLLPKFFKVFTLYIMLTLSVFFGYTKLFGNVAPVVIGLPTDDVDAEEETYFNSFVNSIMNFKSVDADINLNLKTNELTISATGNVVVTLDEDVSVEINDLDLTYNDQHAIVSAIYQNSNLYLAINDSVDEEKVYYSFDLSDLNGSSGVVSANAVEEEPSAFKKIFDFLSQYFEFDMSVLDEFGQYIGIDFNNLDPTSIMSKLKIIEKERELGGYYFNVSLGTAINAEINCDKDFNIETIVLNPINLKGNVLSFDANVSKMNNPEIVVEYDQAQSGIDLSELTKYVGYAKNLFENNYIRADIEFAFDSQTYSGTLFVENADALSAKLVTNIEGIDLSVGYKNDMVYVEAQDLKFKFDINNYDQIKDTIDTLLLKYTNKTTTDFLNEILLQYTGKDLSQIDFENSTAQILGGGISSLSKFSKFLPQTTNATDDDFEMLWDDDKKVKLSQNDDMLKSLDAQYADYSLRVEFSVIDGGFEFDGAWFNVSKFMPLSNVVDKIIEKKQLGGTINLSYNQENFEFEYFIDFADGIVGQISFELFGEKITILANEQTAKVKIGEIVVECEYENVEEYLTRLQTIFGFEIQTGTVSLDQAIPFAMSILRNVDVFESDDKVVTISYLSNLGVLEVYGDKAIIEVKTDYFDAEIEVAATENEIQTFEATDTISDIIEKVENIYELTKQTQFAFDFEFEVDSYQISGKALVDLEAQAYRISGVRIFDIDIDAIYDAGRVYLKIGENSICFAGSNIKPLVSAITAIMLENGIDLSANIEGADPVEFINLLIQRDISSLSLEEIIRSLQIKLFGSLDRLKLELSATIFEETNAQINVWFEDNKPSKIFGNIDEDVAFALSLQNFTSIEYDRNDYFNLIGAYSGTLLVKVKGIEQEIDVEIDLTDGIYMKASGEIEGERVEMLYEGGEIYVKVGELVVRSGVSEIGELKARVSELFGIEMPEMPEIDTSVEGILGLISTLDLNAIDATAIEGLTYRVGSQGIGVTYASADVEIVLELSEVGHLDRATVPTEYVELTEVLDKYEAIREQIERKKYAFTFNVEYKGLELSGEARVDLEKEEYSVLGLEIYGNEINATYRAGRVYVEYAGNKLTFSVDEVKEFISNLQGNATTSVNTATDPLTEILDEIFGEDIRDLDLASWKEKISVRVLSEIVQSGLSSLVLKADLNTVKAKDLEIEIEFSGDEISKLGISSRELNLGVLLSVKVYEEEEIETSEYLELITAYSGVVEIEVDGERYELEIELDLRDGIYMKASGEVVGERVEMLYEGGEIYVKVGELVVRSGVSEIGELKARVSELFGIEMPDAQNNQSLLDMIPQYLDYDIDLTSLSIIGSTIGYAYTVGDMDITIELVAGATIQKATAFAGAVDFEEEVLPKIENIKSLIDKKIYEFDFDASYNSFDFDGKLKIDLNNSIFEISDVTVCGEKVYIRIEDKKLYFAYGNMRYKFDISENQSENEFVLKDFLTKILGDTMPVEFNFGRFESLLIDLRDKDLSEILSILKLDIFGSIDDLTTKLYRVGNVLDTEILSANIDFENNFLKSVDLRLYEGIISATLDINNVDASTISPLADGDFAEYSEDFVRGMLDSLAIETPNRTAYTFGGDIAIRYSNTNFYGDVVAMLVERENAQGKVEYVPAVAVSTTALNLNTYIYLIEDTIYLDVHGLQIQADLTQTTIDEVMDFVETNFDISLSSGDALEATSAALHVILPAFDEIYATWINGGIKLNIGHKAGDDGYDRFTYGDDYWFYDMVAKVFIDVIESGETGAKTVVPTEVVFGANIHDPNTKVYDSYDEYLLKENDEIIETIDTRNLNFAVYLRDIEVGGYFEDTLNETFIFDTQDPTKISKVKSNYGTTNLSDFSTYNVLLDIFDSGYSYVSSLNYKGSVDATIQTGNNKITLGANIVAKLDDLPEGATSAFTLYGNKYLKVQGNIDASMYEGSSKKARHLLDVLYESNDSAALYATYSHDDYTDSNQRHIGKNSFKAKINNANLSGIVSIIVDMLDIDLGSMRDDLSIDKSYIDYRFVQTLMNIGGIEAGEELSSVDQTLSSVEEIMKLIRNMKLTRQEISNGLYSTTLMVSLDWEDEIATLKLVWNEEVSNNVKSIKLRQIKVENFVFGESTINLTINLTDYTESSFNYNTSATHINMSSISDFTNVAINTLNTKEFNFTGSTSVSIIGISAISVGYDLYARIGTKQVVENGKTLNKPDIYVYLELSVGSVMTVTYDSGLLGHDYTTDFSFDSRISTLVYENNKLTITQKTHRNKGFLISAKDKTLTWSYNSDQIGSNIMKIMAQAIGLTNSTYNIISDLVESMNPYPSLEQTLEAFSKGTNQYTLKLDGTSLTGDSNFADMEIKLGLTTGYSISFTAAQKNQYAGLADYERSVQFIDSIETTINIASGTVKIPVKLSTKTASSGSYKTSGGRTIYVNNYYRNNYITEYKNHILSQFQSGQLS